MKKRRNIGGKILLRQKRVETQNAHLQEMWLRKKVIHFPSSRRRNAVIHSPVRTVSEKHVSGLFTVKKPPETGLVVAIRTNINNNILSHVSLIQVPEVSEKRSISARMSPVCSKLMSAMKAA